MPANPGTKKIGWWGTNNWLPDSYNHKVQWVSECLCRVVLPCPTLSQKRVGCVAGCSVRVERTREMSLFSMCLIADGH